MSEASREMVEAGKSRLAAALIEYFAILDRGVTIDLEPFLAMHSEVAADLRSYIAFDEEARRIAQGAKLQIAPGQAAPEASTHSVMGPSLLTSVGGPRSAGNSPHLNPATTPNDLPATFGRYQVEKKLGSGAMGAVYLAIDSRLDRRVALKTPLFQDDPGGELLRRFYREARAVSKIKHQNLCGVYDVGEIDGRHYISMEFVPGRRLTDFLKSGKPIPEKYAMDVVRKIAMAMHEAHLHGVIHRDLKPDNVMINDNGEPVVMDFGLVHQIDAKNSTRLSHLGALIGSPAYMSKEQVLGDHAQLTPATDQYSLGVIFYQLLTGRLPFEGSVHAVLLAILMNEPLAPSQHRPGLDRRIAAICMKMMSKDAINRYPSMKAVAEAIANVTLATSENSSLACSPDKDPASSNEGRALNQCDLAVDRETLGNTPLDALPRLLRRLRFPIRHFYRRLTGATALVVMIAAYVITLKVTDPTGASTEMSPSVNTAPGETFGTSGDPTLDQQRLKASVHEDLKTPRLQRDQDYDRIRAGGGWHGWSANAPMPAVVPFSPTQAKQHQQEWAEYLQVPIEYTNSIGMKFVLIPPGEFVRGMSPEEIEEALALVPDYEPVRKYLRGQATVHNVVLTQPKYVGIHEVTRAQFLRVTDQSPSRKDNQKLVGVDTANLPVDTVNWFDAITFCAKLSNLEQLEYKSGYCLPTEAEWQFACQAGTNTRYWNGDSEPELARLGWYGPNSGGRPHTVGELAANPFGLFDVHGNVVEWCQDRWDADFLSQFKNKPAIDPHGPSLARNPGLVKGGDFCFTEFSCRTNIGFPTETWYCDERFGFRVVLPVPQKSLVSKITVAPSPAALVDRAAHVSGKGAWQIQDGELRQSTQAVASLLFGNCEWTDYDFQAEVMRESGVDGIQIFFRAQDPGNLCLLSLGGYGNKWHEAAWYFKGHWGRDVEMIPNRSLPDGEWQKVMIKVRGNRFILRLNNEQLFEYEETRFPCGLVGLQTFDSKARFRNLKVTDPDGNVLWEGFPDLPSTR